MQEVYDQFENVISSSTPIRVGVPQGSILLFILYISDLKDILRYCKYNFYADDLQIYLHCVPRYLHNGILDEDIESIVQWTKQNGFLLNSDKTQAILFDTARYTNAIDHECLPNIMVDEVAVQFSSCVKYLGVYVTGTLAWDRQVTSTVGKIRSKLYQLKISKHLLTEALKVKLIVSRIFPHLDYCYVAFTDITAEQNLRLHRALNACIRFVFNVRRDEYITPYHRRLRWLKVNIRRSYFVGCQLFNIIHQPSILSDSLTFRSAESCRSTKVAESLLSLPPCRTELYRRSFKFSASKLWNDLPPEIRDIQSIDSFKDRLYEYLMQISDL